MAGTLTTSAGIPDRYLVEYSLSVDNIFVFVLVLRYFAVPAAQQHRVLFYGIIGALVFRGVFIALGSVLMRSLLRRLLSGLRGPEDGLARRLVWRQVPDRSVAGHHRRRAGGVDRGVDGDVPARVGEPQARVGSGEA